MSNYLVEGGRETLGRCNLCGKVVNENDLLIIDAACTVACSDCRAKDKTMTPPPGDVSRKGPMSQDPDFKAWPVFKNELPGHARIMEEMDITDAQREGLAHLALIQKTHWVGVVGKMEKELSHAHAQAKRIRDLVSEQAKDEGIWFRAETGPEGYLQQELRKLHAAIEGDNL